MSVVVFFWEEGGKVERWKGGRWEGGKVLLVCSKKCGVSSVGSATVKAGRR